MKALLPLILLLTTSGAQAADYVVSMNLVHADGESVLIGEITITETSYGLVFTPKLSGLPPGVHGFHLHENPSCAPKEKDGKPVSALAAGGHYDPGNTGSHQGPWGDGHLGDLPALTVDADGNAVYPVLAPRLKPSNLNGHALMIHIGGDNHSDHPDALGGGGVRIACGVID